MTLVAVLAAPWLLSGLLTIFLPRFESLFTPAWSIAVLAGFSATLAATTWTSALAGVEALIADRAGRGSTVLALVLGGCLLFTLISVGVHAFRVGVSLRAGRVFRNSPMRVGDLLTIDSDVPDAFAVPGRPGVVVVTTAMIASLGDDELAAVLAHERSHLAGGHQLLTQVVELARRLNPVLWPWGEKVRFYVERAADESAARLDRGAALRAVARAALLCAPSTRHDIAGFGGQTGEMVRRARALQQANPPSRRMWLVAAAVLMIAGLAINLLLEADIVQDHVMPESNDYGISVIG